MENDGKPWEIMENRQKDHGKPHFHPLPLVSDPRPWQAWGFLRGRLLRGRLRGRLLRLFGLVAGVGREVRRLLLRVREVRGVALAVLAVKP